MPKPASLVGALLATALTVVVALVLLGQVSYVTTSGTSMAPRFRDGDLAVLRAGETYSVGDVAAYRSEQLDAVVLHRIIRVDGDHYTFAGDNNGWVDPEHPSRADLVGELAFRVPRAGAWLARLLDPVTLGALTATALALGGAAGTTHLRRRNRRRRMAQHRRHPTSTRLLKPGSSRVSRSVSATAAGLLGLLGLLLAAPAWGLSPVEPRDVSQQSESAMRFSYTARVAPSAAYDGTTVRAPSPVFRRLARAVDVRYDYSGPAGPITVAGVITAPSGWQSDLRLTPIETTASSGTVRLDLVELDRRMAAAARASGMAIPQATVTLTAQVRTPGRPTFSPRLALTLTPLQLLLDGDPAALEVRETTAVRTTRQAPRTLAVGDMHVSLPQLRVLSAVLLVGGAATAGLLWLAGRRRRPWDEAAAIRHRWAGLIVEVEPLPNPAARPIVDVVEFATLAKLAERYGLLVLHWSRSGVDTFVVQDEGTTYRYRTGDAGPIAPEAPEAARASQTKS